MEKDFLEIWLPEKTENTTSVVEFGSMYFEKLGLLHPNVKNRIGIEIHQPYIDRAVFNDCIKIQGNMQEFEKLVDRKHYDCALFVDSLEHLPMDKALDLIARCKKVFNKILVAIPEGETPQDKDVSGLGGDEFQMHRSVWWKEDLQKLGFSYEFYFHDNQPSMFAEWNKVPVIKYSFLMPYYNRESLEDTLNSFVHWYPNRLDYEVVIIEGKTNSNSPVFHSNLLRIIAKFPKLNIKHLLCSEKESFNPAGLYNFGCENSTGKIIVLTSPECYHEVNILEEFDKEFRRNRDIYVVCGCQAAKFEDGRFVFDRWYQHSLHINRLLHFCTALTRENFYKIEGFDEEYSKGIAYEDDDFREKILNSELKVVLRDDLVVTHINHNTEYQKSRQDLVKLNEAYYRKKWHKEEATV